MNKINTIAKLITEDPDVSADRDTILLEWGNTPQFENPLEQKFVNLLDAPDIEKLAKFFPRDQAIRRAMDDLMMEFEAFKRHTKMREADAVKAFEYYKKNKSLPQHMVRDSAELDRIGGRDFRP